MMSLEQNLNTSKMVSENQPESNQLEQDPEVVAHCQKFETYLNLVKLSAQPVDMEICHEVEADTLTFSIQTSLPIVSEVEFTSKNYSITSMNYEIKNQCMKLDVKLNDFKPLVGNLMLHCGQTTFTFPQEINPNSLLEHTENHVLNLPMSPINWKQRDKIGHELERIFDYQKKIKNLIMEYLHPIAVGDVVTLTKYRVGRVCYIGELDGKSDLWYGIDIFYGTGKHNGSLKGKQYFMARNPTSGSFVKGKSIIANGICPGDVGLKPRMKNVSDIGMHGVMVQEDWLPPIEIVTCEQENRPGYNSMPSHEYREDPRTLQKKITLLADLIRRSNNCMAYTGAGISTTAGIDDYASKYSGKSSKMHENRRKVRKPRYANPTLGHRFLTQLYYEGHLKHWVQQNHDGLPQKAGYPQHEINEIHGGWWDPSNAIIPMQGSLRDDLFDWMCEWQEKADLCLTMGTSLAGMNADSCFADPAERYIEEGVGLGSIIVGLQRTPHDHESSIRFYGTIDEVVSLLAKEMSVMIPPYKPIVPDIPDGALITDWVFKVPYDMEGKLTTDPDEMIIWDLRFGKKIRMALGSGKGFEGVITNCYPGTPHLGIKTLKQSQRKDFGEKKQTYWLGCWWLETFTKGLWHTLPFVNVNPQLQKDYVFEN